MTTPRGRWMIDSTGLTRWVPDRDYDSEYVFRLRVTLLMREQAAFTLWWMVAR